MKHDPKMQNIRPPISPEMAKLIRTLLPKFSLGRLTADYSRVERDLLAKSLKRKRRDKS